MAGKGAPKSGGRAKGTPNKVTADLRDMIRNALEKKGGQEWLEAQMDANPVAFMSLISKIIPAEVNLGGQKENPVVIDTTKLTTEQLKTLATIPINDE
jgi:hypothetical protein